MRIIDIALKDLLEIMRDKKSLLFLVLMPVVFTVFMGFAFRASEGEVRLPVGWLDSDPQGVLGAQLRALVDATEGIDVVPLAPDQVRSKIASVIQRVRPEDLADAASRERFLASLPAYLLS